MSPPYWINMGAVAISTLAGTIMLCGRRAARGWPAQGEWPRFIKGLTLNVWADGNLVDSDAGHPWASGGTAWSACR